MIQIILSVSQLGYRWEIDARVIAKDRAHYYASKEEPEDYEATLEREYALALTDHAMLCDWYEGNMNWDDIPVSHKVLLAAPVVTSPSDLACLLAAATCVIRVETREIADDTVPTFHSCP